MSIPTADNPAATLLLCLHGFRNQSRRATNRDAWAAVFGVHPTSSTLLILGLAGLVERVEQAQTLLAFEGPTALALRWVEPVNECLAQSAELSQQAALAQKPIDQTCLLSLEACAAAIGNMDDPTPPVDQVQIALQLTDDLMAALAEAELPLEARALMVRHVLALQQALKLLPVVGMDGVYDAMIGAVDALERAGRRGGEGWYQRLQSGLAKIAKTLHLSNQVLAEAGKALDALPPGHNPFHG